MTKLFFLLFGCLLMVCGANGAIEVYDFESDAQRDRYYDLAGELRCPKCQNQNLSGSNSQIAQDMRREVHRLISEGGSDQEVKQAMVERYGEFVLYKPRFSGSTVVLWLLPLVMLLIGLLILFLIIRQRKQAQLTTAAPLSEEESSHLKDMLNKP